VIVAADFEGAVRERVADRDYAARYTQERLFGQSAAKVITQEDGSIDLIVDAALVHGEAPKDVGLERLFSHEAYHVLMTRAGESLNDIRLRRGLSLRSTEGHFVGIAGVMSEEFRVERALCEAGLWPDPLYRSELLKTLDAFATTVVDGVTLRYPDEPIERTFSTVFNAFSTLATLGAYLAAEEIASKGSRRPDVTAPRWQRYVGEAWPTVLAALRPIPSAAARCKTAELDLLVDPVGRACEQWLKLVGFSLTDRDEGLYFDVITHDFV
jgi:hypothetical protein